MSAPEAGIHLAHKRVGETSFSLVQAFAQAVQRAGIRRDKLPVSHGGALDPFAHGLVLLLAGPATRLMDHLHGVPKSYAADVAWGVETDSGDHLGRPVGEGDPSRLTPQALDAALAPFVGWHDQVPPATSNKRVGGERAYQKAHRGEAFELPPSRVYLHAARFVDHDLPRASRLELVTGGGYYVRSLVRDLGRELGCGAHLRGLWRSAIGPWRDPGEGATHVVQGAALLPWLRARELTAAEFKRIEAGQPVETGQIAPAPWPLPAGFPEAPLVRALHAGKLVALLRDSGATLLRELPLGRGV